MASISIGFVSLAVLNLIFNIPYINYIMVALSIYSLMMSLGQHFYNYNRFIKVKEFDQFEKKLQRFFKIGFKIGVCLINYSVFVAVVGTFIISQKFENEIDTITTSVTLIALSALFMNIGLNPEE